MAFLTIPATQFSQFFAEDQVLNEHYLDLGYALDPLDAHVRNAEGQQYGTDREIATISLLKQQPLILWTGDAQQTPGGIARTAPNAKRLRKLLLAKRHGLRSNRTYFMPSNLAEAMVKLLEDTANDGLTLAKGILSRGEHALGNVRSINCPKKMPRISTQSTQCFRSLVRLAWMLQHAEILLPMAGEIQAELNCHTAGVSDHSAHVSVL